MLYDEFVDECKDRLQDYLKSQGEQAEVVHETVKKLIFKRKH